jgi:hypothetical protein
LFFFLSSLCVSAEVAPVSIRVPEARAWTGQRLPFFVELRARGSFAGAAGFSLPEIPRSVILKVGNPVVSSEQIEGESWFVQAHEFALFSQQSGTVEIPSFPVRFGSREGFTGPVVEEEGMVPASQVEIRRPPGTEDLGFLITTESLEVVETWEPLPGPAMVGAVFKRTIVQRSEGMTGMALAAAPVTEPDGIRIYPGQAEVRDKLERGDFLGERRETITYLLQEPGRRELPPLTYVWWDPKQEEIQSRELPAVVLEVAPDPAAENEDAAAVEERRAWWWIPVVAAIMAGLLVWRRDWLSSLLARWRAILKPPERVAARALLRACRQANAADAQSAWHQWCRTQDSRFQPGPELSSAVLNMQRSRFGPAPSGTWQGSDLARAFVAHREAQRTIRQRKRSPGLPPLNAPR